MALQRKQDWESTGYWPCSSWTFRKVTRRLVQGTAVELAGTALLAARGTGSPSPPPTSKPAFPGEAGLLADGAPGCWGQGEPPSCRAAWCQIAGPTLSWSSRRWGQAWGVGKAPGQPSGKCQSCRYVSDSPAFLLQEGGWHQTLTNGTGSPSPSGARRSDG